MTLRALIGRQARATAAAPSDSRHRGSSAACNDSGAIASYSPAMDGDARSRRLSVTELHAAFVAALGGAAASAGAAGAGGKPLDLECASPLPRQLRVYLFNATEHPSERRSGDYRIQLRLPGQRSGHRGSLETPTGGLLLLAGYVREFNVFVLWDARAHEDFPYSKGVQVGATTVHHAAIRGMMEQQRRIRSAGRDETVIASRFDHLVLAIQRREELTRLSVLGDSEGRQGAQPTTSR